MTELVLTYVGTVLIAMEFVRKFTELQALMGMLVGWPVSSFFGEKGSVNWSEINKANKVNVIFRMFFSLILCVITLPLTVAFHIIWFIILILNSFHNWVNRLYSKGKKRYRTLYLSIIRLTLFAYKISGHPEYARVKDQKVMKHIEEQTIPILPLIGIILLTIAFIMQILK
jgi:hypothetical protein